MKERPRLGNAHMYGRKAAKTAVSTTSITQEHRLADGSVVSITRNGRHQYRAGAIGSLMPGVTTLVRYLDGDGFGAGMGWATKVIRENEGDTTAPRRSSDESRQTGEDLHEAIHNFIQKGRVSEDELFLNWYHAIGKKHKWIVSEQLVYHPDLKYGGTADALSMESNGVCIWDWKSKESASFEKVGSTPKDHAQIAAYAYAYREMRSEYYPVHAKIAYIMRDKPETRTVRVDLEEGWELFATSLKTYNLVKRFNSYD
jgi:hypothetical protein